MNRRSKAPARALAFIALAAGLIAIVLVISSSIGDDGDGRGANRAGKQQNRGRDGGMRRDDNGNGQKAAAYVVQSGDTLTGIAAKTGVSVSELQELNPGIDPQILVSGQRLKLR
ncbi:MAG TPA: LysM domain-containing protein [Solirubrobacterales bacterium]|nr:LysM domain-containing protein [Solirubrobacterales bacterium]